MLIYSFHNLVRLDFRDFFPNWRYFVVRSATNLKKADILTKIVWLKWYQSEWMFLGDRLYYVSRCTFQHSIELKFSFVLKSWKHYEGDCLRQIAGETDLHACIYELCTSMYMMLNGFCAFDWHQTVLGHLNIYSILCLLTMKLEIIMLLICFKDNSLFR